MGPAAPQQAADSLLFAMEAVAAVARKHGLLASFLPKLFKGAAASGQHCHFRWGRGPRRGMVGGIAAEARRVWCSGCDSSRGQNNVVQWV